LYCSVLVIWQREDERRSGRVAFVAEFVDAPSKGEEFTRREERRAERRVERRVEGREEGRVEGRQS